ncbi:MULTISPECIES: ABC transporter ATP-binding protein [unclassified Agarivorans]|uniref:ABC transporter ATP-binding protein n=1 Tax=unclassified Agarivorans TaxID=2636026 RepID=UPI0026E44031|nr:MULTISPECIES: ATP-binding cassette domain-containing protein [unclassified Agarivorans]MDO6685562.1 ATP-binding cassette domain-containing protein [Agarivorans sp. 3_MG-2023]MDO6715948.1 ATP-binding cassette domain-containing protein [Agarivorans sp. 2_MG-2023]
MNLLIQLTDLSINAKELELLQPLSLSLYQDKSLTILGQTGSGKSLLAQAIIGLLPNELSQQGQVEVFGKLHDRGSLVSLWGKEVIMLPQEPWRALDPLMPAYQQVLEVYECLHGLSHERAFNQAMEDLEKVDLKSSALKRPGQLSGGMAQRLAVTAATAGGAKLILADEPTKGLDVSRRDDIVQLLLQSAQGGGLLTITHDIEVARQIGGDIIVMKEGVVVEQGSAEQVLNQPEHSYTQSLIGADPRHWVQRTKGLIDKKPVLSATSLAIGRNGQALSAGIDFTIHAGEVVGVVGDSGSGKSTLGDTLLNLLPPISGKVSKQVSNTKPYQWLKLFQDPPAAFTSSVSLGVLLEDVINLHQIDRARIAPLMIKLKLAPELLARRSTEVSGGELQRFAILRALLLDPIFLFADEPTSRLDPIIAKEVTDLLVDLAKEQGCALLLVSHDPHMIEKRCDTVVQLK